MKKRTRLLLCLCLALLPASAYAATPPPTSQHLTYAVYAGGINALAAELTITTDAAGRYHVALGAQTRGLLGHLAPWRGGFESWGTRPAAEAEQASRHRSQATWRRDTQVEDYSFNPDGTFASYRLTDAGKDKTPPLDHHLADGTTDALTATLIMLDGVAAGKSCAGSRAVFDGLRRYKLVFKPDGNETLVKSGYNIYGGPAARCTAEIVPDGGKWHDKPRGWLSIQEQGRQKGALPTVWIAPLDKDGPAVPVRVKVVTAYGTLFMQLTGYKSGSVVQP